MACIFGVAGSNNDINVLNESLLLSYGKHLTSCFEVNENQYKHEYYLVDGIYPDYAIFVKTYVYTRLKMKIVQGSARIDKEWCRTGFWSP